MIDLKILRENPDAVRHSQKVRGEDQAVVGQLLEADAISRTALSEFETLRAQQNALSKSVGAAKGEEKAALLENAKDLADRVKAADSKRSELEEVARGLLLKISNLIDLEAPVGGEADFKVIEEIGKPRDFKSEGFPPKDHVELGKILKAIDTERGAKVAGSRSYYLTGPGAMLEFALVNFAITSAVKAGFIPVIPPVLVNPAAMEGTGFLGQAAENVYHLEEDDLYLVGTSEVPLAAYHMDEIVENLPIRYAGYSSCFRREAGTYGKDTRGIIRVHQFDKVEMFSFIKPEDAKAEHLRLLEWEKDFLRAMEVPFRVIDVASGDLGSSAIRKFDCEAWIPTQGAYREVTSTSNCTEFQARRLNIRYRDESGTKPVATLNGTLVAVPRMIVAILENHQNKDGSINIPKALRPFLGVDTLVPSL
ncbi:MAG: serine--tRNA ligase [Actinobacteria bacterium]|uniref:serine--tRNA ligase n=1 Tax=freshwater metagenome TaxID=449393 RepID=A0A6J7RMP2_9ZZZZ|nr:serine--tRNA ligase [Actinomycetota bacterium]MSW22543.1 serine--tRNA ligase [Actinomycetota bacterium]MSX03771.1 serine--tRNA ligase [Actinomycetota bacterium]MSX61243.1 serine--tRNA ligase [Actinomycetota bacterium]MSX83833.1 serine--tRNA ligase [Actinomycetota bacterium]